MILKYVDISVAVKMSLKFRGVSQKYQKIGQNSRKIQKYKDASKMISFAMIGAMQNFWADVSK